MERGVSRAPAVCTLLLLGIGLLLQSGEAEVIASFGPFSLRANGNLTLTNTTSDLEESLSVSPLSPDPSGTITVLPLNSVEAVDPHLSEEPASLSSEVPYPLGTVTPHQTTIQGAEPTATAETGELATTFTVSYPPDPSESLSTHFLSSAQAVEPTLATRPEEPCTVTLESLVSEVLTSSGITTDPLNSLLAVEPTVMTGNDKATTSSVSIIPEVPNLSETISAPLSSTIPAVEPTAWLMSSKAAPMNEESTVSSLIAQPSTSLAVSPVLYDSVTTHEPLDTSILSVWYPGTSTASQAEPSTISQEIKPSILTPTSSASVEVSYLNDSDIYLSTEALPMSTTYCTTESSSMDTPLLSTQPSTPSQFHSTDEGAITFFCPSFESSLVSPVTLNVITDSVDATNTADITSILTKNELHSVFPSMGLSVELGSTTSLNLSLDIAPFPSSSTGYEVPTSVVPDVSGTPLITSKEAIFTLYSSPWTAHTPLNDEMIGLSNIVTSELKHTEWTSRGYLETISTTSSGQIGPSIQSTVVSDTTFLEESTTQVLDTVFSWSSVVPSSTWNLDNFVSSAYFTSLVDSALIEGSSMDTSFQSQSVELETSMFSVIDSTIFMPSLTEHFFSATASVIVEPFLDTTAMSVSTPALDSFLFEPSNTKEAPAFAATESVVYFSQTWLPSEESVNISDFATLSVDLTVEPSSLWPSLSEEALTPLTSLGYSELSKNISQGLSAVLATSDFILSSSVLEPDFIPTTETINFEGSGDMPWQTSITNSFSSLTPFLSTEWTGDSSSVFSESSELLEATSVLQLDPGVLYTSNATGSTSPLLPLLSSSAVPETLTSSIGSDHTSSALIEETLQTSLVVSNTPVTGVSVIMTSLGTASTFFPPVNHFDTSTAELPSTPSVPLTLSLTPTLSTSFSLIMKPTTSLQPSPSSNIYSSPTESSLVVATSFVPTLPPESTTRTENTVSTMSTTTSKATGTTYSTTTASPTPHVPITPPSAITALTSPTTTRPPLLCDITNPEPYLVTAVVLRGTDIVNLTESIKNLLTIQFNRSVELEVYAPYPRLSFMVTSGPFVYTSFAVENALSLSSLLQGRYPPILSLQTTGTALDQRYHIQTVLQFVPQSVDIRLCTFSEQIQRGLSLALYEVRRWRQEDNNFTLQIVNITSGASWKVFRRSPVTISYTVKERGGYLNGSEVSDQLRNLSLVEFSFFLGFPVKQIAEPSRYPQLNVSPSLKDSWLKTVLLGVMEPHLQDEAFQAEMERKLAQLIGEATMQKRRWKRASFAGGNTVQVVNVSRLEGSDDPVQLIYFIEDQYGGRLSAAKASDLINEVNIQRAAIIMGYRLQGVVARPLNQVPEPDRQMQNLWIIVGVVVPVLVVTVIIVILYWKLCRTDKLDFQPDTMSNLQQRQKLQAPCVKGFDFAKQHLGQHNKDEILVVHEPPPPVLHGPLKDSTPSENGEVPTPKSKGSSKPLKVARHRGRITPSDTGSTASEPSSGKESAEEGSPRPSAPPREIKSRPVTKGEMPVLSSGTEQHSSASIFEHVDRMSRSSEASRRFPSKIQLIAMQPIAAPPMHGLSMSEREVEANKINREIQTTLRHKSEIEHHRNKIRLRAKRKGHYEFPLVDVVGMTDTKERQRMYRKAQMQFDKILDPVSGVPTVFIEPRRSSRARRSPKQRRRQPGSGSPPDADRDRLIATDSDGTYKRQPGVSNSAYVSDPDLPSDNPTPVSDLGKFPGSPHRPPAPAQYVAPQPSIEEVRQTMQSLLDDAFALVAPGSQTSGVPGVTQTSGPSGPQPVSSTPARTGRTPAPWGSPYAPHQASHFNRYVDYNMAQPPAPNHLTRNPGFGSGFLHSAEVAQTDPQQADSQYPARGIYSEEIPPVARPRPLGSTAGSAQIHQLTQVGIASRIGAQTSELQSNKVGQPPAAAPGWSSYYHPDEESTRNITHREPSHQHGPQDYGASQMFSGNRVPGRQPLPTNHLTPSICYPSGSAEDLHPGHSSASLIKAIREELLRLSQKQAVVTTYHS
ncbi:UPF0606 protein KIAA1549 homolog isoform X2 [Spea bombifrons]|uniref:UPF0606 protein KIAA1549 homolog isoform X2 n=1 Tax=Spea bombifrons TaxID=233779 RepID=UPI00234AD84B|nr:UPF0606 protein KIAA1549 homolog isoform X2 [Spea bombifrons]